MTAPLPSLPRHRPLAMPLLLLGGLATASGGLMLISVLLSHSSTALITDPVAWLDALDVGHAFDVLSNAAEVVAAVLAIAMTVVAIVVELAANRYSHEITRLFLREPVNLVVLGLLVITTLQCVWASAAIGDGGSSAVLPNAGFAITITLVTLCLLLLVPYIYFVFTFLSPISVIERICRDAYRVILRVRQANVTASQGKVEESVDQLQDVGRSAIAKGDRSIAMAAVDAMARLLTDYVQVRERLPDDWFRITESIAGDADFVALAPETREEVERQGIWLERKVFRRYLSLMNQSAGQSRDVANVIGINTQRIATELGGGHPELLDLCLRAFNSYLRTTINARDPRTAYFLMNQYRLVAEHLLTNGAPTRAVTIAGYLREYGHLAQRMGLPFLLETAAYDVMQLCEEAIRLGSPGLDPLLDCLLTLDQEILDEQQAESLLAVRRAQIQLATLLLETGDDERAGRIVEDLQRERLERLERLRQGLLQEDRPQYWEIMDRGVNFSYLAPERRVYLEVLFERIRGQPL